MSISQSERPPQVPEPPQIKRRIAFNPTQAIGMPIIMLVPLLGLFGLFDTTHITERKEENGFALSVRYPKRFRHTVGEPMLITVENNTGHSVPKLVVKLSGEYLDAFENVQFIPDPEEIDKDSVKFEFADVAAGETRRVEMEMEAAQPGPHDARVEAGADDGPSASLSFKTLVLP